MQLLLACVRWPTRGTYNLRVIQLSLTRTRRTGSTCDTISAHAHPARRAGHLRPLKSSNFSRQRGVAYMLAERSVRPCADLSQTLHALCLCLCLWTISQRLYHRNGRGGNREDPATGSWSRNAVHSCMTRTRAWKPRKNGRDLWVYLV